MPRLARLPFISFGWYYVSLHSVPGRNVVTNDADIAAALTLLRKTFRGSGVRLHAGSLAEHEAHLALQAGERPLSAVIGEFQQQYARLFNRMHGEQGALFRLHHRELLIQHERWLVSLVHFIHWRSRLAALDNSMRGLSWSSDAMYRGKVKHDWLTTNVVLRMLSPGPYRRQAQESAYRLLMERMPARDRVQLFSRGSVEDPRIVGDATFIENVYRLTGRPPRTPGARSLSLEARIPDLVRQCVDRFNSLCEERLPPRRAAVWRGLVTYDNLRSRSRTHPLPAVRALIASYLIRQCAGSVKQAAEFFGRSCRTVSRGRRKPYEAMFREWFGAGLELLFDRDGHGHKGLGQGPGPSARPRAVDVAIH